MEIKFPLLSSVSENWRFVVTYNNKKIRIRNEMFYFATYIIFLGCILPAFLYPVRNYFVGKERSILNGK